MKSRAASLVDELEKKVVVLTKVDKLKLVDAKEDTLSACLKKCDELKLTDVEKASVTTFLKKGTLHPSHILYEKDAEIIRSILSRLEHPIIQALSKICRYFDSGYIYNDQVFNHLVKMFTKPTGEINEDFLNLLRSQDLFIGDIYWSENTDKIIQYLESILLLKSNAVDCRDMVSRLRDFTLREAGRLPIDAIQKRPMPRRGSHMLIMDLLQTSPKLADLPGSREERIESDRGRPVRFFSALSRTSSAETVPLKENEGSTHADSLSGPGDAPRPPPLA